MGESENLTFSFQERLDSLKQENLRLHASIDALDARFDSLLKVQGPRPKQSEQGIKSEIAALENQRMRSSGLSAKEESKLLDRIHRLGESLKDVDAYRKMDVELKSIKSQKGNLWSEVRTKEGQIQELENELKKIQLSVMCGLSHCYTYYAVSL